MIELTVKGIALDQKSGMPIILLTEKNGGRLLPIWIGPFEASSIILQMEGVHPPRALTHDILAFLFKRHGLKVKQMEIYGALDDSFLSKIIYRSRFRTYSIEVRPSDGIALALRTGGTILAEESILASEAEDNLYLQNLDPASSEVLFLGQQNINSCIM
ncbi:MAG: bifunctional nuclease family protein [Spirochaetales bacterium]|nr:bifunctional nuclease family protein [Spirochaetales bacterium]